MEKHPVTVKKRPLRQVRGVKLYEYRLVCLGEDCGWVEKASSPLIAEQRANDHMIDPNQHKRGFFRALAAAVK